MSARSIPLLVVDDEPPIRRLLRTSLAAQGYRVLEAATGRGALDLLAREAPEVMLLDLGLPDLDGLEVICRLRASGSKVPVIVLSSRDDERGKVEALNLGADDYVTKPFGMGELVARIRTALRHRLQVQGAEPLFMSGDLTVDLTRRLVTSRGKEVRLSNKEWDILRLLVLHAGQVLTHRAIMREVWGPTVDVQYLRIYVRQLRQKLEQVPEQPRHILTETGVGYRLRAGEAWAGDGRHVRPAPIQLTQYGKGGYLLCFLCEVLAGIVAMVLQGSVTAKARETAKPSRTVLRVCPGRTA